MRSVLQLRLLFSGCAAGVKGAAVSAGMLRLMRILSEAFTRNAELAWWLLGLVDGLPWQQIVCKQRIDWDMSPLHVRDLSHADPWLGGCHSTYASDMD